MAMSWMGATCLAVVACWLLLTILAQFRPISAKISPFDPFRLIPIWTFFAPYPGMVDYHLVVRDELSDGSISPWRSVDIAAERHLWNFLWNPQKRPKKIVLDAVQSLAVICKAPSYKDGHELVSLPYLLLLHCADTAPTAVDGVVRRQFAIVHTTGHREKTLQLSYLSRFHARTADLCCRISWEWAPLIS